MARTCKDIAQRMITLCEIGIFIILTHVFQRKIFKQMSKKWRAYIKNSEHVTHPSYVVEVGEGNFRFRFLRREGRNSYNTTFHRKRHRRVLVLPFPSLFLHFSKVLTANFFKWNVEGWKVVRENKKNILTSPLSNVLNAYCLFKIQKLFKKEIRLTFNSCDVFEVQNTTMKLP